MANALSVLFVVSLLGLGIILLSDNLQTLAKYRGAIKQRVAGGYNLAMKVMVLNRIGAVIFFLSIALNIDHGISSDSMIDGFAIAFVISCLPAGFLIYRISLDKIGAISVSDVLEIKKWPITIAVATFGATLFNLMGITLPLIAGATFPDYRLTLANTSFVFNTVYTVINVFYIEDKFAKLVDSGTGNMRAVVACMIFSRMVAFFVSGVVFLLL